MSLTWPRLHAHWNLKRTTHTDLNEIAYDAIDHAFQNVSSGRHCWFAKHVAHFGPVGLMMHRRKEWNTPACPWCGEVENTEHVWTCQSATVTELWEKRLKAQTELMDELSTDPNITAQICSRLAHWRTPSTVPFPKSHRDVETVCQLQDAAGWELAFTGMWRKEWIPL